MPPCDRTILYGSISLETDTPKLGHHTPRCRYCDTVYKRGKVQKLKMHVILLVVAPFNSEGVNGDPVEDSEIFVVRETKHSGGESRIKIEFDSDNSFGGSDVVTPNFSSPQDIKNHGGRSYQGHLGHGPPTIVSGWATMYLAHPKLLVTEHASLVGSCTIMYIYICKSLSNQVHDH